MANEGTASIEIVGDVRNFARDTLRKLNAALAKIKPNPVEVKADGRAAREAGERAGEELAEGVKRGADGRLRDARGKFVKDGEELGKSAGAGAKRGFMSGFGTGDVKGALSKALSGIGDVLGKALRGSGSAVVPAVSALGTLISGALVASVGATLAPALAGVVAAAVTSVAGLGLGAGLLGLGAFALKDVKSLRNSLKGLGETLKEVGRQAAQPLIKPFLRSLAILKADLKFLQPVFKSIFKGLAGSVQPLTQALSSFTANVLGGIKDSLPGITAAFTGLSRALPEVGRMLGDFFRTIFGNKDLIDNTTEGLIKLVAGPLRLLGPMISGLNVVFGVWNNALRLLAEGDYLGRLGQSILEFVDGGSGALGRISAAWEPLRAAIIRVWDALKAFAAEDDSKQLEAKFQAIVEAIKAAWGPLGDFISQVWDEAVAAVQRIWDEKFMPWWNEVAAPWLEGAIRSAFEMAWNAAVGVVTGKLNVMRSNIWNRMGGIPGLIMAALNPIGGIINRIFMSAVSSVNQQLVRMAAAVIAWFSRIIDAARRILGQMRAVVTAAFAGAGNWLVSAGANIINGLLSGIRAGFGRVRSLLSELTAMLPSWKGPETVDKKILEESGRLVMKGFQTGLTKEFASIERTLGALTGGLSGWAPTKVSGAASTTNMNGMTFNIYAGGTSGQDAGRQAAEQVLQVLAQAQMVR